MSKKIFNTVVAVLSLVMGGLIYLVFRENTFVARRFEVFVDLEKIRNIFLSFDNSVLRHYIPDFLWAFSLCCGLNVLLDNVFLNASIAFTCGAVWEMLQYLGTINGTGDIIDIIMYLTACVMVVTINKYFFKEKKNEKTY